MLSHPSPSGRPPRHWAVDPPADEICPPAVWIRETLHRAKLLGLHPNQRRQIATLLGWIELEEFDLPRFWFVGRGEVDAVTLLWAGNGCLVEAGLHWSASLGWRTSLSLFEGKNRVEFFWPAHPAAPLRAMLERVEPGLFRSGRG